MEFQSGEPLSCADQTNTEEFHSKVRNTSELSHEGKQASNKSELTISVKGEQLWLWEILACVFSFICMCAVIGILTYEDGKPIDQWTFRITPNAIVSFVATLAKSAFLMVIAGVIGQLKWQFFYTRANRLSDFDLFDEASRGPWGSSVLLVKMRQKSVIASGAATITLLALFVDPFVQLVISFPSQPTIISAGASGQYSDLQDAAFLTNPTYNPQNTSSTDFSAASVDGDMQTAILKGLYNGADPPTVTCKTGNCTFHNYTGNSDIAETLGVCGQCTRLTHEIRPKCSGLMPTGIIECEYELAQNISLQALIIERRLTDINSINSVDSQTKWNSTVLASVPNDNNNLALLADAYAIQVPNKINITYLPPAKAYHCDLRLCSRSYAQIKVNDGVVQYGSEETHDLFGHNRTSVGYCDSKGPGNYMRALTLEQKLKPSAYTDRSRIKCINNADFENIKAYLRDIFTGGWSNLDGYQTQGSEAGKVRNTTINPGSRLAEEVDLDKVFKSIAQSMTETIRTGPGASPWRGQAYIQTTVIEIQWAWLAYPLVLMLMSVALLVSVMLQTWRLGIVAWKCSSLAVLFHHIDGIEVPLSAMRCRKQFDKVAGNIKVKLSDKGDRPAFVKED